MKRVIGWFVIIASVLLSVNLARSVYDLNKRGSVVDEARDELAKVQSENDTLKQELDHVKSPAYIEKQARDKLNLARPNETVLIVPEVTLPPEEKPPEPKPVWKQWMNVFGF